MADIKLPTRHSDLRVDETSSAEERVLHSSLPPTDGGKDAWLVLAGCTILEALVWGESSGRGWRCDFRQELTLRPLTTGFPFAFGVFQEHYSRQEQFMDHISTIPAIGTTATVGSHSPQNKGSKS
jgi:hypothetical protein